jgi:hypothetical protein
MALEELPPLPDAEEKLAELPEIPEALEVDVSELSTVEEDIPPEPVEVLAEDTPAPPAEEKRVEVLPPLTVSIEMFDERMNHLSETVTSVQSDVSELIDSLKSLTKIVADNNRIQDERWRKDSEVLTLIEQWLKRR